MTSLLVLIALLKYNILSDSAYHRNKQKTSKFSFLSTGRDLFEGNAMAQFCSIPAISGTALDTVHGCSLSMSSHKTYNSAL